LHAIKTNQLRHSNAFKARCKGPGKFRDDLDPMKYCRILCCIALQSLSCQRQARNKNPKIDDVDPDVKNTTMGVGKNLFDESGLLVGCGC